MTFYSGYACDVCGKERQYKGLTANEVLSITHLRKNARNYGWSVGKERVVCNRCRRKKSS